MCDGTVILAPKFKISVSESELCTVNLKKSPLFLTLLQNPLPKKMFKFMYDSITTRTSGPSPTILEKLGACMFQKKKVQNYQVPFFLTLEGRFTFLHAYFLQTFILCQILGQSWCQK